MRRVRNLLLLGLAVGLPYWLGVDGCGGSGNVLFGIDESTEIRIGQQAAAQTKAQHGVVNDPLQYARINRIGRAIAAASPRPNRRKASKSLT